MNPALTITGKTVESLHDIDAILQELRGKREINGRGQLKQQRDTLLRRRRILLANRFRNVPA